MKQKPLRIAMFTNNYYPFVGGVPISIDRLTRGLRKRGHTVVIFAPQYPEQEPDTDPDIIRCKLLRYHRTKLFDFAVTDLFSRDIDFEFARRGFDIIHVHHPFWMGAKGLTLGRKYGIPVVLTYHTRFDKYYHYLPVMKGFFKSYISHSIVKYFTQRCDAVFSPTQTSLEYLESIGVRTPATILPTGVEIEEQDEPVGELRKALAPGGEALLCTVSRLAREKNIGFLLDGIRHIKEHTATPFKCVIIGDGPERGEMEDTISRTGLRGTVLLAGTVTPGEVARYYRASDLFVFASRSETQGMVLLEAMAGRCPVVAVSSGGVDDMVIDGYNGYKTREDIEDWSQRVIDLMANGEKLRELSQNAAEYAKRFSLDVMAEQAETAYRSVIRKKGRHGRV